jgi:hypothetical protein
MSLMRKYFAGKEEEETSLAIVKTQTAVVLKGKKIFDIYEDGNGQIRAKHKSGDWLRDRELLTNFYTIARKYSSIQSCHEDCEYYIKSHQLRKVGTVEFIPSPKEEYDE